MIFGKKIYDVIVEAIADPASKDIATDAAELVLDSKLPEGILKDVPIIKWFAAAADLHSHYSNRVFAAKLLEFLTALKDMPESEREAFADRLEKEEGFKQKVGKQLFITLERLDDLEKPALLAKAFRACITGKIDYKMFRELSAVIDRCFLDDLPHLKRGDANSNTTESAVRVRLTGCGVIEIESVPGISAGARPRYKHTSLGDLMCEHVLS